MSDRGVSIQFVLEFCVQLNLWNQPTWWVCENIIKPACAAGGSDGGHCRFVDTPVIAEKGVVGRAKTFVSHAWGAPFGLIVVALLEGEPDMNRHVWIDIFAVLQFEPKPEGELRFDLVIPECTSFLLVVPYVKEIEDMDYDTVLRHDMSGISEETFRQLPMYRVWCLVEIFAALQLLDMVVVMKVGRLEEDEDSFCGYKLNSANLVYFLQKLSYVIDVKQAKASVDADRVRILEEHKYELPLVNAKVRGLCEVVLYGSEYTSSVPLVSCAAMGDAGALSLVKDVDMRSRKRHACLHVCAGRGFTALLRELLDTYPADDREEELLRTAAQGGQVHCVRLLIEEFKFNANHVNEEGDTACMVATSGGHIECVRVLLEAGADVNAADKYHGGTAIGDAAGGGHTECLCLLLKAGADVNAATDWGLTACMKAAEGGHTECLRLLLEAGADIKSAATIDGDTALKLARNNNHSECVVLLESYEA